MRRFALVFASLVISSVIIGCGDGGGAGGGTGAASEDQSTWGEAKKDQAKRAAEAAERAKNPPGAKKK